MLSPPAYPSKLDSLPLGFLGTDEFHETVSGLYHTHRLLLEVYGDPTVWKWVLMAAHNTLQNACVCILTNTSGTGALYEESTKSVLAHLNADETTNEKWPGERLADLPVLVARVEAVERVSIAKEVVSEAHDLPTDLLRLHKFRNDFSHYKPGTWLIELAGLPRVVEHSLIATQNIINSSSYRRRNRFQEYNTDQYFDALFAQLKHLQMAST